MGQGRPAGRCQPDQELCPAAVPGGGAPALGLPRWVSEEESSSWTTIVSAGGGAGGTRESPGCCPCVCGWRLGARSSSERRRVGSRVRFPTSLSPRNAPFCKTGITLPNSACRHEAQTERLIQKISRNRRGNIRERGINAVVAGKSHARASLSRGGRLLGADANRRRSPLCARGQMTRH